MKKKGCLIPILVILIIFIALLVIMIKFGTEDASHPLSTSQKYIDDLTDEQSKQIDFVLSNCGIENISSIEHDDLLDNAHKEKETGYRIKCDRADNVILYLTENMEVYSLVYADNELYADGKVKATIQDFTFSTDEATKYQLLCEDKVKAILKSPSTAKFPNIMEWGFGKTKKEITVQGYVNAQNSFNTKIRSDFQFKFDKKTNTVTSFIFDGQEQIKK